MAGMFRRHSPQISNDRVGQGRVVMHSWLDWTIVKPSRLTRWHSEGEMVRRCRRSARHVVPDLADFLVAETLKPQYIGQTVLVCNGL
jgi:hypothetical protein